MKKNRIKKFIAILVLLFIVLMQSINSFAAVAVTKENLKEVFEKAYGKEGMKVNVSDNNIIIEYSGKSYEINYFLEDKLKFTTEVIVKKGITYEEYKKNEEKLIMPLYWSAAAIANSQGIDVEDAEAYFALSLFENIYLSSKKGSKNKYIIVDDSNMTEEDKKDDENIIYKSEFGEKIIECIDELYYRQETTDSNIYRVVFDNQKISEDSYKIIGEIEIDLNGDYSKMNGSFEKFKEELKDINNTIENSTEDFYKDINVELRKNNNTVIMANKLLEENERRSGKLPNPNVPRYPNAGLETNIFVPIIEVLIGILVVMLICMIIKVREYKKD